MDLNEIVIYQKVVERGSFTQAARQLEMPVSTVSAKISTLEKSLGVTLIRRTTRKLFVTPEGQKFYERCLKGLREIRAAKQEVAAQQKEPQGLLRLTAPVELGAVLLPDVIEKFKRRYPQLKLDLVLTDRNVDLVSEGFDLAIRAGKMKDSSLIVKKIGDVYFAPFASPSFLKKTASIKSPKDLQNVTCLQFSPLGLKEWEFEGPKSVRVPLSPSLIVNDITLIKALTIKGLGVSLLPTFLCYAEVHSGKLVRVLPDWRSHLRSVQFVSSGDQHSSAKVKAFISVAFDSMKERFQSFDV